jgi:hypothetical protein
MQHNQMNDHALNHLHSSPFPSLFPLTRKCPVMRSSVGAKKKPPLPLQSQPRPSANPSISPLYLKAPNASYPVYQRPLGCCGAGPIKGVKSYLFPATCQLSHPKRTHDTQDEIAIANKSYLPLNYLIEIKFRN